MSYILDALRKSERQRGYHATPSGTVFADTTESAPSPRRPWNALMVAALLANAAVLGWALWPAPQPAGPGDSHQQAAARQAPAQPTPPAGRKPLTGGDAPRRDAAPPAQLPRLPAPDAGPAESAAGAGDTAPATDPSEPKSQPAPHSGTQGAAASEADADPPQLQALRAPDGGDSAAAAQTEAAPDEPDPAPADAPFLEQLPKDFQRRVPDLEVNVHVYADSPGSRFVLVNMRRYREGETLQSGPRLERITPEGVVLTYRGRRFLMPVQ